MLHKMMRIAMEARTKDALASQDKHNLAGLMLALARQEHKHARPMASMAAA